MVGLDVVVLGYGMDDGLKVKRGFMVCRGCPVGEVLFLVLP